MSSFTPALIIYDITINLLETNLRLAESFAALDRGGEGYRGAIREANYRSNKAVDTRNSY